MEKIHASIIINAPKEVVWNTMLTADTYSQWTQAFSPAPNVVSKFIGDWTQGSKILFVATGENNTEEMGMVSRIAENREYEFISIEHLGILKNGIEDTTSDEAKKWVPAYENYTFIEREVGTTELCIDQDIESQYKEEFQNMWNTALLRLKELSEAVTI
jgi:hypothetical protein